MYTSRIHPVSRAVLAIALAACAPATADRVDDGPAVSWPSRAAEEPILASPAVGAPDKPSSRMTLSRKVTCADPGARERLGPYRTLHLPEDIQDAAWFWGAGVAIGDLDGDGHDDWFFPGQHQTRVYHWDGRMAVDVSEAVLPAGVDLSQATAAVFVDIDGDTDLDVFVTRYQRPNVLLRNDGGVFVDDTAARGLAGDPKARSVGASFADPDRDGDLDVFVSNYGPIDITGRSSFDWSPGDPNQLLENTGGGVFVDHTDLLHGPASTGYTFLGGWFDLDDDGDWEIYVVNDFGEEWGGNALVHFDDWSLTPDDNALGLDVVTHGMGLGLGDVNDDGTYDLLISAWANMHMLVSQSGAWFDSTAVWGLDRLPYEVSRVAWGNDMADLDNDGLLELIINFGFVEVQDRWPNPDRQPDIVLRQTRPRVTENVAPAWGLDQDFAIRGAIHTDLNGDGYLDLVKAALIEEDVVHLSRCGDDAFLDVTVDTPTANTRGIGTRIRVQDGDRVWLDTLRAGGRALSSGEPPRAHFGLGDRETVERVDVRWPDGSEETWFNVPTRRAIHLSQK